MIKLPPLPYAQDALEPYISSQTVSYHYGKHHKTYVDKLNGLLEDHPLKDAPLEDIVKQSSGAMFNNAAQIWNHTFYWESLSEQHQQKPSGALSQAITDTYGSLESFIEQFSEKAATLFGSGWVWLVIDANRTLQIIQTKDAQTPLTTESVAILTCDVWEHAYYLDTQNARPNYIQNFWKVVNWQHLEIRYQQALEQS